MFVEVITLSAFHSYTTIIDSIYILISACYIDIDEEIDFDDPNHEYSSWCNLPDILLEEIFSYLSVKDRYYASLVTYIQIA